MLGTVVGGGLLLGSMVVERLVQSWVVDFKVVGDKIDVWWVEMGGSWVLLDGGSR